MNDLYYLRRLSVYIKKYWYIFIFTTIGLVINALTEAAIPIVIKPFIDGTFVDKDQTIIKMAPVFLVCLFLIRGIGGFMGHYFGSWLSTKIIMDIRNDMFQTVLKLPAQTIEGSTTGKIISKFTYDASNVAYSLGNIITIIVKDTLLVLGLLSYLFFLDWKLTLITFLMIPPIVYVVKYFNKRLRKTSIKMQEMMSEVTQTINETTNCNKIIKIYDGFENERNKFLKNIKDLRFWQMKQSVAAAANVPSVQFFVALVCSIIIYYVTIRAQNDLTTVGGFISYIAAMLMLSSPIKRLTSIAEHFQKIIAASKSVFDFMDEEVEPNIEENKKSIRTFSGRITFEKITYSYPNSKDSALKNISLKINAGDKVAIVGSSGSGKTTLANLITKFIDSNIGNIYFDDIEIKKISVNELRKNIAFVGQQIDLFNDSVKNNIAYGELSNKNEDDIRKACEFAYASDFITNLPEGLNTKIGERGSRLSGGQRQRIAIARAILKDAPIIIFDEATAALDSESEKFIQLAIENISKKKTCLIIAHRLSTIKKVDKIIVLENGSIVEAGTHDELIKQNKQYANFIKIQNI